MVDVGTAVGYLDLDNSKFIGGLSSSFTALNTFKSKTATIGDKLTSLGSSFTKLGTGLSLGVTVPLVGAGVAFTKFASDAESSFAKVGTIIDESVVPYEKLKNEVIAMSNETGVAITDFNEALYQSISASIDSANAIQFTTEMNKLAVGGFTELEKSVDVVTTVINAYGMSAEDATMISDRLITTQNLGKTTVDALASSMGKVIPTAKAFNVSFDDVSASMALLTKNGISTHEATTYLNSMLNELGKSGTVASKALMELTGKTFTQLINEGNGLSDILMLLQKNASETGLTLIDMFGSAEAGKAAISLISNAGKDYIEIMGQMKDSTGAAQKAFDKMDDTPARRWEKALNKLKNAGTQLGYSLIPAMEKIADVINSLADKFNGLNDSQRRNIVTVGKIIALVGPIMLAIGSVIKGVGRLNSALGAASGPVGVILALVGAIISLITWMDSIPTKADELNDSMQKITEQTSEYARTLNEVSEKMNDFSEITDEFGMTQQEYADKISAIQSSINSVYSAAIGERRALSDEELLNLEEYYSQYEKLRQRQINQDIMFNDAQIDILKSRLQTEDLSVTEIASIENTLADLRSENALKYDEYAASEIVTAQLRKDALIASGEDVAVAEEQYNSDVDEIYSNREKLNSDYAEKEKETLNEVFEAHQESIKWEHDLQKERGVIITNSQDLITKYGEEIKKINDDQTLNWAEKRMKENQLMQGMLADMSTLVTDGELLWENYTYFQDQNFAQQAASYFKLIDEKVEAGQQLTDEDKRIAGDILGAYSNLPSELQESGKESLNGILSGIENEELRSAIDLASSGTADDIISAISDEIGTQPTTIGEDVTRGIGNGLDGSGPFAYVGNVIKRVAGNIISGFKKAFGIASPSKKGRWIGDNVSRSIALGLTDGMDSVKDAVGKVSDEVLSLNDIKIVDTYSRKGNLKYDSDRNITQSNSSKIYNVSIQSKPQNPLEIAKELKSMEERLALGL